MGEKTLIEINGVSKYFAKVIANKDVTFNVNKGEVLALLGENGAGKSTIMKILYGLYSADEGEIKIDGKNVVINNPKDAMKLGISMIQQHFSLVSAHTVTENIILGNVTGKIDYKKCEEKVKEISKNYGFDIPVNKKIKDLDVGTQQKVEIVKALYLDTKVLIMDEPTAVLTPQEAENLMEFVRGFVAKGNSVIFITHKLKEVMEVADRIVVMRNGLVCGDISKEETDEIKLSKLMIGKDLVVAKKQNNYEGQRESCLEVNNITLKSKSGVDTLKNISFEVKKGEIFAIAGVSGNGQEELCKVLCGDEVVSEGNIKLDNEDITHNTLREHIEKGIGYVPVDRYRDAMIMNMNLAENMFVKSSYDKKWNKNGLIDKKKLDEYTNNAIKEFNVKASGPDDKAGKLSGGNQQKIVLAREVKIADKLLILNQPTRGLDLGAINNIHTVVLKERDNGKAVILISTELSEIFELADTIAVMYKGEFMGIYKPNELNTEKIGMLMAGYKENRNGVS